MFYLYGRWKLETKLIFLIGISMWIWKFAFLHAYTVRYRVSLMIRLVRSEATS
jgi:hypothetical protein